MKKILFSIIAVLALASCAKTEPAFEQPGEISFSPVSRYNTKAAVTDQTIGGQSFYVFANTVDDEASAKYFENILFVPDNGNKYNEKQVYCGNPAQFWPNVTPLKFAGYTKSGSINSGVASMDANFTTMTITGYEQPYTFTDADANNDFMWFFDYGKDSKGYTKNDSYVVPVMKHALSWITIKVKVDVKLTEDRDDAKDGVQSYWSDITVDNIKFESVLTKGDVALGTAAVWTKQAGPQENTNLYDKGEGNGIAVNSTEATVIEPTNAPNNIVVIPQTPARLSVTYTYTAPAGGKVTETVTGISLNYDPQVVEGDVITYKDTPWAPGTHYTYDLTISADEIKIAPSSAAWENYGATDDNPAGTPIGGTI